MTRALSVTQLLAELRDGRSEVAAELIPLVYDELHRLAKHYMRNERSGHTLQATALVNEAYLRLVKASDITWESRAHFIGVAAQIMRRLLADHGRARLAARRGGHGERVVLNNQLAASDHSTAEWLAIDLALQRLASFDARQSRIVELRYFGGLSVEETALVIGVSPKTVKRDWALARAWLRRELGSAELDAPGGKGEY